MLRLLFEASADTSSKVVGPAELAAIAKAWATVIAIAVAGTWTYLLFVRQRQRYPRATMVQTGLVRDLDATQRVLTVGVALTNIGQRLIQVDYVTTVVQQLAPLGPRALQGALAVHAPLDAAGRREIMWYRIGHRRTGFEAHHFEIEPGETERIEFDFVIARSVTAIKVRTHVENVVKRFSAREWVRRKLSGVSIIAIRSANRCLGWQCTTYHNLPSSADTFTKLANVPDQEIVDGKGQ